MLIAPLALSGIKTKKDTQGTWCHKCHYRRAAPRRKITLLRHEITLSPKTNFCDRKTKAFITPANFDFKPYIHLCGQLLKKLGVNILHVV